MFSEISYCATNEGLRGIQLNVACSSVFKELPCHLTFISAYCPVFSVIDKNSLIFSSENWLVWDLSMI